MTIKKKNRMILFIILTVTLSVTGCSDAHKADPVQDKKIQSVVTDAQEDINADEDFKEAFMEREQSGMEEALEKGYNLPLSQSAEEEAEADCKKALEMILSLIHI